jgi:WD40 repeat protein
VHTARDGKLLQTIAPAVSPGSPRSGGLPVTCLRWRPLSAAGGFRISEATTATRNVLLAAGSDGSLRHIHATSGRVLSAIFEADTQLYACDYRPDGGAFASAGNRKVVRVYDEETRALKVELTGGVAAAAAYVVDRHTGGVASAALTGASGHNNRIFSIAWHPTDENVLVSGGWDNTVQIWDVRAGLAVRSIFGPHLGGDGLVFTPDGNSLITASWRSQDTLQVRPRSRERAFWSAVGT